MSKTTPSRMLHGCLLAHPTWFAEVADLFDARDFDNAIDKKLWATHAALREQGQECAPLDALAALEGVDGASDAIGPLSKLMRLCAAETSTSFARRVDDFVKKTINARAKRAAQRIMLAADDSPDVDWAETYELTAAKLRGFDRRQTHFTPLTFERFIETASDRRRKVVIPTGYAEIDKRIGGFIVGHTTLICARTNVGKSGFLASLARNQFAAGAAKNPARERERDRSKDPYTTRLEPAHARHPKNEKVGEREPFVLVLSVEDDVDDYLGRFVCDLCDIRGKDYMLDPEHEVYRDGGSARFEHVARTFTRDGRLTIADYENEDGDDEKTIDAIEKTILGWKRLVEAPFIERGEDPPPLLVLLDYFQKIELPEEEGKAKPEYLLLKKASARLHKLAKRQHFALVPAVMLLRAPDDVEPDHNAARGGSDVIQDAEVVLTLWPFGPGERAALEALKPPDNVRPITPPRVVDDSFEAAVEPDEDVVDELGFEDPCVETLDVPTVRRAINELIVAGHKGRHVQAGWQVPLEFDREYKRITDAYAPNKIYRRDPDIVTVLREYRKASGQNKKR